MYDNDDFRIKAHSFDIICNFITVSLRFLVFWIARRKTDWSVDRPEVDTEIDVEITMMADQDRDD